MNPRQMGMLAAVAVVGAATSARAQNTATVRSVERLVKAGRANTPALFDAKIGTALGAGDRLRTGGRSAAGMRFPDQSVLRMGELSEVVVTGANRRDTRVIRGQVAVDFKRPGTISGGYAVAAVRGTEVYYLVDESRKRTVVNCYEGRVFVSSSRNGLSAGTAATVTRTTLSDPDLQGTQEWTRGEIVFVDGPYAGQSRRITGFDGTSGTVTFEPSLPIIPEGAPGETGYLLVRRPDLPVVELTENTGTTVREGGNPTTPRRIPREEFAMLQREPFFRDLYDGRKEYVFPGTREMWRERDRTFTEREALRRISRPRSRFFFECCDTGHGENPTKRRFGVRSALQGGHDHALQGTQAGSVRLAQAGGSTPTPEDRYIPGNVQSPAAFGTGQNGQFLLEPFAFGSDDGDALGARVRYQGVSGTVFAELGYLYQLVDGQSQHDISEGFLHVRGRHGDVIAGRQHRFIGPANNNQVGTLLGLEAVDAVIYEAPLRRGFRQEVGYLFDTRALRNGGERGAYARGQAPVFAGNAGYSVLVPTRDGRNVGWSLDAAQPLIRNVLDVYAEGGKATGGRNLFSGGLYIPALYHRFKLDTFLEYANREDLEERVSLRLRREMGNGLLLVGFVDRELGTSRFTAGGGVVWTKKFR